MGHNRLLSPRISPAVESGKKAERNLVDDLTVSPKLPVLGVGPTKLLIIFQYRLSCRIWEGCNMHSHGRETSTWTLSRSQSARTRAKFSFTSS